MNIEQIIKAHLKAIGADGLCNDECGCGLDDLAPCDGLVGECEPARKGKPPQWAINGGEAEEGGVWYCPMEEAPDE